MIARIKAASLTLLALDDSLDELLKELNELLLEDDTVLLDEAGALLLLSLLEPPHAISVVESSSVKPCGARRANFFWFHFIFPLLPNINGLCTSTLLSINLIVILYISCMRD